MYIRHRRYVVSQAVSGGTGDKVLSGFRMIKPHTRSLHLCGRWCIELLILGCTICLRQFLEVPNNGDHTLLNPQSLLWNMYRSFFLSFWVVVVVVRVGPEAGTATDPGCCVWCQTYYNDRARLATPWQIWQAHIYTLFGSPPTSRPIYICHISNFYNWPCIHFT